MTARLQDKVAIITGSASGFGAGMARLFVREGATVVLADLDGEGAGRLADELAEGGARVRSQRVDVTDGHALEAAVAETVEAYGRVDVLVNNAGIGQRAMAAEDIDDELFERVGAVNMYGVFAGCRAVIPVMKRQGSGAIINTASTAAVSPRPLLSVYNASKGFVLTLTQSLAIELAASNIRVNALNPVISETGMYDTLVGDRDPEQARAAFLDSIPLGRMSTPEDVGWAAVYLASDESSMVTGVALEVDGGRVI
jgi:3-oxoacyl-[acyl-carrier protein] reductase